MNNCNNISEPFSQEDISDIPEKYLFRLKSGNTYNCFDIRELLYWIKSNPIDPLTNEYLSETTIIDIINKAKEIEEIPSSDIPDISSIHIGERERYEPEFEDPVRPVQNLPNEYEYGSEEYDFSDEETRDEWERQREQERIQNDEDYILAENIANIYVPPQNLNVPNTKI